MTAQVRGGVVRGGTVHRFAEIALRALVALGLIGVVLVGRPQPASADLVVSKALWQLPYCCPAGWETSRPEMAHTTMSAFPYTKGQTIRIVVTIGSTPGKGTIPHTVDGKSQPRQTGVSRMQAGWSGQKLLRWGTSVSGTSSVQSGTSVIYFPKSSYDEDGNFIGNNLFGPGDSFWVEFEAPEFDDKLQMPGGYLTGTLWLDEFTSVTDTQGSYRVVPYEEEPVEDLEADFDWALAEGTRQVTFTDRSTSPSDEDLEYRWDFGGEEGGSTDQNPVHTFASAGDHEVSLEVTDGSNEKASITKTVSIPAETVVNSTGDGAAEDPAEQGCDTGGTIDGGAPECTLRAALEVTEEQGGGMITFDVPGSGVPSIAVGEPLPTITEPTTVDGASQPGGGQVEVTGSGPTGFTLGQGTTTLKGLVINGFETGVLASGGTGHTVTDSVVGADPTGLEGRDSAVGIRVDAAADVVVDDNVIGSVVGVLGLDTARGMAVTDNAIGVGSGGAELGMTRAAVLAIGPGAIVTGNTLRGETVAAQILGGAASGARVADNHVGLDEGGAAFETMGYGIRVDGAPGATVAGNDVVADAYGAIVVAGSVQSQVVDDELELLDPDEDVRAGPVTGGGATITDNTVAIAGDGVAGGGHGIVSWAGASNLTIARNLVGGVDDVGIELVGGAGHRVVGNTIGSASHPVGEGITITDAAISTVGGAGTSGNTITAQAGGIAIEGDAPTARVEGNTVATVEPERSYVGIDVPDEGSSDAVIIGNTVVGGITGIGMKAPGGTIAGNDVSDQTEIGIAGASFGGTITENTVTGAPIGIGSLANRATVSKNTVTEGGEGIVVDGSPVTITENRVGLAAGATTVTGNDGSGISIEGGTATVTKNIVAGSADDGIDVVGVARATLRANRVWQSGDEPIAVADGPEAPGLQAAIRADDGGTLRTTLLVTGLPEGDAGTLEVFSNDSCDDPEAQYVLELTRQKEADEKVRILQLRGNEGRDHFTVTYTDDAGSTSELSNCEERKDYPDRDDDGSVDPLDAVLGNEDDPTQATIATDAEQLLTMFVAPYDEETGVGGGQIEGLRVVDDPAPEGHPDGWSLPHGAISFRITGLEPGSRTAVLLATLTGQEQIGGGSYWKYGPPATGGPSSWYRFDYDDASGTGATLTDAAPLAGALRRAWVLQLGDGLRGDSDGGANGTITDPGGPVIGGGDPVEPTDPPPTVPTTEPAAPTTTPATTPASPGGALTRTGWSFGPIAILGLSLLGAGALSLACARRRRPGYQHQGTVGPSAR